MINAQFKNAFSKYFGNESTPASRVEWACFTDEEKQLIISQSEDADYFVILRHESEPMQDRIDEFVPFTIDACRLLNDADLRLVLVPEYSGPAVLDRDVARKYRANLLPFILPSDTLIDFVMFREVK